MHSCRCGERSQGSFAQELAVQEEREGLNRTRKQTTIVPSHMGGFVAWQADISCTSLQYRNQAAKAPPNSCFLGTIKRRKLAFGRLKVVSSLPAYYSRGTPEPWFPFLPLWSVHEERKTNVLVLLADNSHRNCSCRGMLSCSLLPLFQTSGGCYQAAVIFQANALVLCMIHVKDKMGPMIPQKTKWVQWSPRHTYEGRNVLAEAAKGDSDLLGFF